MALNRRKEKIKKVAGLRQEGVVVLEDIHDPHNAAAVLRSCEAFGVQKVYFIFEREKRFNPKKVGKAVSSSANKWLDFKIFASTDECLRELKRNGYHIVATVLDGAATSLLQTKFKAKKLALLLGNEHRGLSRQAIALADEKVYVPMRGFVQSLNLSVTAAVCLYEIVRQRNLRGLRRYFLSAKEQKQLTRKWLKS